MRKVETRRLMGLVTVVLLVASLSPAFASATMRAGKRHPKKEIGELHNQGVRYVLERLKENPKSEDGKRVIISLTKRYLQSIGEAPDFDLPNPLPKAYEGAIGVIDNIQGSETLKAAFRSLIKLAQKNPKLSELNGALTRLEREVAPQLRGKELNRFSETISVARSSATFWAPTREGGINGRKYLNPKGGFDPEPSNLPWWFWDAVGFMEGGPGVAICLSLLSLAGWI